MFSQVPVILSTGCGWVCLVPGPGGGYTRGRRWVYWGGGVPGVGTVGIPRTAGYTGGWAWPGTPPVLTSSDDHWSGRHTSYCKAFLFYRKSQCSSGSFFLLLDVINKAILFKVTSDNAVKDLCVSQRQVSMRAPIYWHYFEIYEDANILWKFRCLE